MTAQQVYQRLEAIAFDAKVTHKEAVAALRKEMQADIEGLLDFWNHNGDTIIWSMVTPHLAANRPIAPTSPSFAVARETMPDPPRTIRTVPIFTAPARPSWRANPRVSGWDIMIPTYRNGEHKRVGDLTARDVTGIWSHFDQNANSYGKKAKSWRSILDAMDKQDTLKTAYPKLPATAKTFLAESLGIPKTQLNGKPESQAAD